MIEGNRIEELVFILMIVCIVFFGLIFMNWIFLRGMWKINLFVGLGFVGMKIEYRFGVNFLVIKFVIRILLVNGFINIICWKGVLLLFVNCCMVFCNVE